MLSVIESISHEIKQARNKLKRKDMLDKGLKFMNRRPKTFILTMIVIIASILALEVAFLDFDQTVVTNAEEISTGRVFHIEEDVQIGDGYMVATRSTGKYYLVGERPRTYYEITEYTYREDGQVNTYVLKDLKTGEQRTMRRLYGDERVMRTRQQLLNHNEMTQQ